MLTISDIRDDLMYKYIHEDFVIDKSGVKTVELIGESFLADSPTIFGQVNHDYVKREIAWYNSESRSVYDIPGGPPEIWKQVACKNGLINSNYGWCIFSEENGQQFVNVIEELQRNPFSRRAEMIYTRPSMWLDYNENGRSDFICTDAVQYSIRGGKVHAHVKMRSNDAIFGYKNDYAWQLYVLESLVDVYNKTKAKHLDPISIGNIIWTASSLHVYERHFYLLYHYMTTGETNISKAEYERIYSE